MERSNFRLERCNLERSHRRGTDYRHVYGSKFMLKIRKSENHIGYQLIRKTARISVENRKPKLKEKPQTATNPKNGQNKKKILTSPSLLLIYQSCKIRVDLYLFCRCRHRFDSSRNGKIAWRANICPSSGCLISLGSPWVAFVDAAKRRRAAKMAVLLSVFFVLCLVFLSSSARTCNQGDYVQLSLPCDEKTRTRSIVHYLKANWWVKFE